MTSEDIWEIRDIDERVATETTSGLIRKIRQHTISAVAFVRKPGDEWIPVRQSRFSGYFPEDATRNGMSDQPPGVIAGYGTKERSGEKSSNNTLDDKGAKDGAMLPFSVRIDWDGLNFVSNRASGPPASEGDPENKGSTIVPNVGPVIVAALGCLLIAISLFMPSLSSNEFASINKNLTIQSDTYVVVCIVTTIIASARYWYVGSKAAANAVVLDGVVFFGWCIFDGYAPVLRRVTPLCDAMVQDATHSVDNYNALCITAATAGAGLWTAGVGCAVIAVGGLMMRFPQSGLLPSGPVVASGELHLMPNTKVCPRCAETIKAAAIVCRYCGHEFK